MVDRGQGSANLWIASLFFNSAFLLETARDTIRLLLVLVRSDRVQRFFTADLTNSAAVRPVGGSAAELLACKIIEQVTSSHQLKVLSMLVRNDRVQRFFAEEPVGAKGEV